jgi:hypothetical protein
VNNPATRLEYLTLQALQRGAHVVTEKTAAKYGVTLEEWLELLAAQGWGCAVCRARRKRLTTDHEHVPGWKGMPAEQRKRYVRGVLCVHCNYRVVHSRLTGVEARRIAEYIEAYEGRRDA